MKVWVVLDHDGWGEDTTVHGVYESEDLARRHVENECPQVRWDDSHGDLNGRWGDRWFVIVEPQDVQADEPDPTRFRRPVPMTGGSRDGTTYDIPRTIPPGAELTTDGEVYRFDGATLTYSRPTVRAEPPP